MPGAPRDPLLGWRRHRPGDRLQLGAFPELGNRLDVRLLGHPILLVPTD
jgi:hypothetical protein